MFLTGQRQGARGSLEDAPALNDTFLHRQDDCMKVVLRN
jgi:hypothetical protein